MFENGFEYQAYWHSCFLNPYAVSGVTTPQSVAKEITSAFSPAAHTEASRINEIPTETDTTAKTKNKAFTPLPLKSRRTVHQNQPLIKITINVISNTIDERTNMLILNTAFGLPS